ncbi:MAG: YARHG domain-containing protein [Bacteroidota bacterium]
MKQSVFTILALSLLLLHCEPKASTETDSSSSSEQAHQPETSSLTPLAAKKEWQALTVYESPEPQPKTRVELFQTGNFSLHIKFSIEDQEKGCKSIGEGIARTPEGFFVTGGLESRDVGDEDGRLHFADQYSFDHPDCAYDVLVDLDSDTYLWLEGYKGSEKCACMPAQSILLQRVSGPHPGTAQFLSDRPIHEEDLILSYDWAALRNEIFARKGYRFTNPKWTQYFEAYNWYQASQDDVSDQLTPLEKENLAFIQQYEKEGFPGFQTYYDTFEAQLLQQGEPYLKSQMAEDVRFAMNPQVQDIVNQLKPHLEKGKPTAQWNQAEQMMEVAYPEAANAEVGLSFTKRMIDQEIRWQLMRYSQLSPN